MNILTEDIIFEMIPKGQTAFKQAGWWLGVQPGKQVPYAFARGFRLASDLILLSVAIIIGVTTKASGGTLVAMELLFIGMFAFLLVARVFKQILPIFGFYFVIVGLAIILNLAFPGTWGRMGLYSLCVVMLYRFPLRWSLPLAVGCILVLIATEGAWQFQPFPQPENSGVLAFNLLVAASLCWFGWTLRTQCLLVMRLHEVQAELREQMVHSEELATERERTRIARDIHDVLSHSLVVLSIQVQAARQLLKRDPERLGTKLDDMMLLIRESVTESRRVVGLLREKPIITSGSADLTVSLQSIAATFNERTGIHCHFDESGTPHQLNSHQQETLQLALREMLTNSHRHGEAQAAYITLRWREASLILTVCDDGKVKILPDDNPNYLASEHHGLQGMRERVTALGGEVEAGLAQTGGFTTTLRLPFDQFDGIANQKVK